MQIYVVTAADSIFSIAQSFNSSVDEIIQANRLETTELMIGQSLLIPIDGQYYTVKEGDRLSDIAKQFQLSLERLANANRIHPAMTLPIGFRLFIPPSEKSELTTFGYIEPIGDVLTSALERAALDHSPLLSYLGVFSYRVNRDGSLNPPLLDPFKEIARSNQVGMPLVITNLEGASFSSELARIILMVQAVQNRLIDNLVQTAIREGFTDIHVDFEFIYPEDGEAYFRFLEKVKARLDDNGLKLSIALAPKTGADQAGLLYEAHDYPRLAALADFLVLMTYEWGYSAGPPLPVSPINEVEKVVQYALTEIPANKILLGQNLYGYDWTLPFVQGESFAKAISPQEAIRLAINYQVAIQYDELAQAPYFHYIDGEGVEHQVWFEDARSIQAKFSLIRKYRLLGIAYWKLGIQFPQNWLLLGDQFSIRKEDG